MRSIFVPSRSLWLESSSNCFINKNCLIIISWALEKDKPLYNVRCAWFTVLEMYCYKRMRFLPIDIKYSHLYHVFFVFTKMCSKLFTYCYINNSLILFFVNTKKFLKSQKPKMVGKKFTIRFTLNFQIDKCLFLTINYNDLL